MIKPLATSYHKLLVSIDWSNELLVAGIREGLNKYLSNAYLHMVQGKNKYHKAHYISPIALYKLRTNNSDNLVFEHMVPKTKYIQEPCEQQARLNKLTIEFVEDKLNKYWKLATITKTEDDQLDRLSMPASWDCNDIFARYRDKGIELLPNPYLKS